MYFEEEQGFIKQSLKVEEKIFETKSKYQNIEVYKSAELGNIMVLDGNAMMSQKDESTYHEMLAHVPVCTHREPSRVLIIGGGDGGTAREVLRHLDLTVDMVEIDEEVVNTAKKYFEENKDIWDNPRFNLTIADGVDFISGCEDKSYDIILVDSTDNKDHANGLFDAMFYVQANRVLKDDGLMAVQSGSWFVAMDEHKEILKKIGNVFGIAMPYRYEMLSYPGINWNFILASKKYHPTADIILQRADLIEGLKYYNSDIQRAAFAVPTYVKKELLGIAKN
ncbi:MAG: polyamine aminopropyltransferase [Epsilonproteobacteria bacterium]|nr:polyamine aminopropyltransferase [Campylobacterota bacterium]